MTEGDGTQQDATERNAPRCDHCDELADVEATTTVRTLTPDGERLLPSNTAPCTTRLCVVCALRIGGFIEGLPLET